MPRKHAANAADHEMPPVASNKPAPTAATSSNTNVAKKKPAAFAKGIHSAKADGESGRASVMEFVRTGASTFVRSLLELHGRSCGGAGSFSVVLERGRRYAEAW